MTDAGLPRTARLRRASDFQALRHASGRFGGRCFSVRWRENDLVHARMGMAVSRRVSKRAVDRNRIKRALRESFRRARFELPALDVLVIARPEALALVPAELSAEIARLWSKLATLKRAPAAATIVR